MKLGNKILIIIIPFIVASIFFLASEDQENATINEFEPRLVDSNAVPLRIGTVSSDAAERILRFQPTADYVAEKLSDESTKYYGKVIITKSYQDMENLLQNQEVDLYFESPITSSIVAEESGSIPFLCRWKEGVSSYHSVFFVEKNSSINSIADFNDKIFVFESPESTSGYFLPKYHLMKESFETNPEIDPEIKFIFSNDDENTPTLILEKKGDVGVSSNIDYEAFPVNIKSKLKIVETSTDIPRFWVSHRTNLDSVLVTEIKEILMTMHEDEQGRKIMNDFKDTTKYTEISDEELTKINEITDVLLKEGIFG
jgi:phosphonate transport system substrate-binding protein